MKLLAAQFSSYFVTYYVIQSNFIHAKIFQSDRIHGGSHNKLTAYYACKNADLNLILVAAMTNGVMFQIINSLMEAMGV